MKYDIVYILKNKITSEELRYSLRSVEKNFPHNRVWFVGGCPADINPDVYVPFIQKGNTKWERSTSSLKQACLQEELSEDFWLFNDDFYVLQPVGELPVMIRGDMKDRIAGLRHKYGSSNYAVQLERTYQLLAKKKLPTLDYALHIPMLVNKHKALEVFEAFPNCPMFRCLYGNYFRLGGEKVKDVKVYDLNGEPVEEQMFASSVDGVFRTGLLGKYMRSNFAEKSRWEV